MENPIKMDDLGVPGYFWKHPNIVRSFTLMAACVRQLQTFGSFAIGIDFPPYFRTHVVVGARAQMLNSRNGE